LEFAMSEMIPDRMPARASKGEKRFFAILQNLHDDYIVYYELFIENRYPDLIIIGSAIPARILPKAIFWPETLSLTTCPRRDVQSPVGRTKGRGQVRLG
jgi:hypothetical protein